MLDTVWGYRPAVITRAAALALVEGVYAVLQPTRIKGLAWGGSTPLKGIRWSCVDFPCWGTQLPYKELLLPQSFKDGTLSIG